MVCGIGLSWAMSGLLWGRNPVFLRIGGCHNEENFTKAMLLAGALAGLAGALIVMGGVQHRFFKGIGGNYAWDGVMIAIVANSKVVLQLSMLSSFPYYRQGQWVWNWRPLYLQSLFWFYRQLPFFCGRE